ncbi:MAG: hypothetical protein KJ042_05020, partial [Deltaproteobacteria bacterium]|nr:hypothetical protein [Deltaproteobacteria bacterium]
MRKSAASWAFAVVAVLAPLVLLALMVGGCAFGLEGLQQPISHHVSEKAEVKVIGYGIAKEEKFCGVLYLFNFDPHYGEMTQTLIDRAIREKGGDVLVNFTTQIGEKPILGGQGAGFIRLCNVEVRGWVAKVEGFDADR